MSALREGRKASIAIIGLLVLLFAGLSSLYSSSHFLHLKSAYDSSNLNGKQIDITDPDNNTNIHFTDEHGIIHLEKPTGIEQDYAPTTTVLSNYPNPFSRETTFRIRPDTETFRVYNIRGQLITDFSDEVKKGVGSADLKNIPSGVYFAKVEGVDSGIETLKFLHISRKQGNRYRSRVNFEKVSAGTAAIRDRELWSYQLTNNLFLFPQEGQFEFTAGDTTTVYAEPKGYISGTALYPNQTPVSVLTISISGQQVDLTDGIFAGVPSGYGYQLLEILSGFYDLVSSDSLLVASDSLFITLQVAKRFGLPENIHYSAYRDQPITISLSAYIENQNANPDSAYIANPAAGFSFEFEGTDLLITGPDNFTGEIEQWITLWESSTASADSLLVSLEYLQAFYTTVELLHPDGQSYQDEVLINGESYDYQEPILIMTPQGVTLSVESVPEIYDFSFETVPQSDELITITTPHRGVPNTSQIEGVEDETIQGNIADIIAMPDPTLISAIALQDTTGNTTACFEDGALTIEPELDFNGETWLNIIVQTINGTGFEFDKPANFSPMTDFRGYMRDLVSDSTVVGSFKVHLSPQEYVLAQTDSTGYFDVQFPPQETINLEVIENDTHYGTKYNNTPALDDVINMHINYIPKPATLGQPIITDDLFRQFLFDLTDVDAGAGPGMKGRIIEHIIIDLNSAQQQIGPSYGTFTPAFQQQIVDLVNDVVLPRIPGQAPVVTALEPNEEIPVGEPPFLYLENHIYIFPHPANNSINHWYIPNESRIKSSRINLRPVITGGTYEELLSIFGYFPIWNPIYHGQTRFHETGSAGQEMPIDTIATYLTPTIKFCNVTPNRSIFEEYQGSMRLYFRRGPSIYTEIILNNSD